MHHLAIAIIIIESIHNKKAEVRSQQALQPFWSIDT
jgi:hypothetical protein